MLARLLIVEDDPFYAELARAAADRSGQFEEVEAAANARRALDRLVASAHDAGALPDLILSDLRMPELDGLELVAALQEHPTLRRIPVAIMTSSDNADDREAAIRAGCIHFFRKPPSVHELVEVMRTLPALCGELARHG